MFRELENQLNIIQEESNLIVDIGSVLENTGKTCTIESSTKLGKYTDVAILGSYSPKKGDSGLLIFAGKYKLPYFIPKFKGGMNPGGSRIDTDNTEQGVKDFVNFQDELEKNPEYKNYFQIDSPREEQWGVPVFIQVLFEVGKSFYNRFNRKIRIGDISVQRGGKFGPHKGVGHASGKGCDLNDVYDAIDSINNDESYGIAYDILNIFKSSGIKAVIWDIQYSKYETKFRQDFGEFIRTSDGGHRNHWHVSIIEPGQYQ